MLTIYETSKTTIFWCIIQTPTALGLREQEELRLQNEHIDRPNTKWDFEIAVFVEIKVILDRQPLQIGLGHLSPWLRNKREVISLYTFNDDCCVFRCLAVHQGARRDYNTRRTRELARSFFAVHPSPRAQGNCVTLRQFPLLEKHFKQGIAAYTVTDNGDFVLSYTPSRYDKVGHPTMTIGIYGSHAFLITDINKVTWKIPFTVLCVTAPMVYGNRFTRFIIWKRLLIPQCIRW